jgi:hypothetical protein
MLQGETAEQLCCVHCADMMNVCNSNMWGSLVGGYGGSIVRWIVSNVALFSALRMEAMSFSNIIVLIYINASYHNQEGNNFLLKQLTISS